MPLFTSLAAGGIAGLIKAAPAISALASAGGAAGGRAARNQQGKQFSANLEENKRQFDLSNLLEKGKMIDDRNQFERSSNMNVIDALANQRAGAMQQFGRRALKDSFFKG